MCGMICIKTILSNKYYKNLERVQLKFVSYLTRRLNYGFYLLNRILERSSQNYEAPMIFKKSVA